MANEAVLIFETAPPIPFTVVDGNAIEKGAFLKLTDPMTASLSTGASDVFAGIAAEEKIANDGKTKIAVYREGIFKVLAGAASISAGVALATETSARNEVKPLGTAGDNMIGTALETFRDTDTGLMELNIITRDIA